VIMARERAGARQGMRKKIRNALSGGESAAADAVLESNAMDTPAALRRTTRQCHGVNASSAR